MPEIILDRGSKKFSYVAESTESEHIFLIDCRAKVSNIFAKDLSEKETAVFGDYDIYIFYKYTTNQKIFIYKTTVLRKQFSEIINLEKNAEAVKLNEKAKTETIITFEPSCIFGIKSKHIYTYSWQIEVFGDMEVKHIINLPPPAAKETETESSNLCKKETDKQTVAHPDVKATKACNNENNKDMGRLPDIESSENYKEENAKHMITVPKAESSKTDSKQSDDIVAPTYSKTSPKAAKTDDDETFCFYGDGEYSIDALMNMDLDSLRKIAESNKHSQ